ncbi:hypothetical protein CYMTET_26861 [Cymbomonas tetramitiformis]|uniref:Uncharacterized protein n=1 Tax=Cymbomonas tetramitiformis TaxID=36881 RepID=A0AAE0FQV5_9CHLO|nr:hypothetical protein CYMTET_26861 [Cymbomonas tetramitiformis]
MDLSDEQEKASAVLLERLLCQEIHTDQLCEWLAGRTSEDNLGATSEIDTIISNSSLSAFTATFLKYVHKESQNFIPIHGTADAPTDIEADSQATISAQLKISSKPVDSSARTEVAKPLAPHRGGTATGGFANKSRAAGRKPQPQALTVPLHESKFASLQTTSDLRSENDFPALGGPPSSKGTKVPQRKRIQPTQIADTRKDDAFLASATTAGEGLAAPPGGASKGRGKEDKGPRRAATEPEPADTTPSSSPGAPGTIQQRKRIQPMQIAVARKDDAFLAPAPTPLPARAPAVAVCPVPSAGVWENAPRKIMADPAAAPVLSASPTAAPSCSMAVSDCAIGADEARTDVCALPKPRALSAKVRDPEGQVAAVRVDDSQRPASPERAVVQGGMEGISGPPLSAMATRVARVHGVLLEYLRVPSLAHELVLLVGLLAGGLPDGPGHSSGSALGGAEGTVEDPSPSGDNASMGTKRLLDSAAHAAAYGTAVLVHARRVVSALGERVLVPLVRSQMVMRYDGGELLQAQLDKALARHRSTRQSSPKLYEGGGPSPSHGREGRAFGSAPLPFDRAKDARQQFTGQEAAAQYNNRQTCIDLLCDLINQVKALPNQEEVPGLVQSLLQKLRPDNYDFIVDYLLDLALQAAVTGEADPNLLSRLRHHGSATPRHLLDLHNRLHKSPSASCSTSASPPNTIPAAPIARSAAAAEIRSALFQTDRPSHANHHHHHHHRRGASGATYAGPRRGGGGGGMSTSVAGGNKGAGGWGSELWMLFPASQWPFALILEAADSHMLNRVLRRALIRRLQELGAEKAAPPAVGTSTSEHAAKLVTLASLLGFLEFAPTLSHVAAKPHASGIRDTCAPSAHDVAVQEEQRQAAVDVLQAVRRARSRGTLTTTLPWVLAFLRFAALDQVSEGSPYLVCTVAGLKGLPESASWLMPRNPRFSLAALCVLTSIDHFLQLLPGQGTHSFSRVPALALPEDDAATAADQESTTVERMHNPDFAEGMVDDMYVKLFIPALENLRSLLISTAARAPPPPTSLSAPTSPSPPTAQGAAPREQVLEARFQAGNSSSRASMGDAGGRLGLKWQLQRELLRNNPEVKRCVDMAIDRIGKSAAKNVTRPAVDKVLKEAIPTIRALVQQSIDRGRAIRIAPALTGGSLCWGGPALSISAPTLSRPHFGVLQTAGEEPPQHPLGGSATARRGGSGLPLLLKERGWHTQPELQFKLKAQIDRTVMLRVVQSVKKMEAELDADVRSQAERRAVAAVTALLGEEADGSAEESTLVLGTACSIAAENTAEAASKRLRDTFIADIHSRLDQLVQEVQSECKKKARQKQQQEQQSVRLAAEEPDSTLGSSSAAAGQGGSEAAAHGEGLHGQAGSVDACEVVARRSRGTSASTSQAVRPDPPNDPRGPIVGMGRREACPLAGCLLADARRLQETALRMPGTGLGTAQACPCILTGHASSAWSEEPPQAHMRLACDWGFGRKPQPLELPEGPRPGAAAPTGALREGERAEQASGGPGAAGAPQSPQAALHALGAAGRRVHALCRLWSAGEGGEIDGPPAGLQGAGTGEAEDVAAASSVEGRELQEDDFQRLHHSLQEVCEALRRLLEAQAGGRKAAKGQEGVSAQQGAGGAGAAGDMRTRCKALLREQGRRLLQLLLHVPLGGCYALQPAQPPSAVELGYSSAAPGDRKIGNQTLEDWIRTGSPGEGVSAQYTRYGTAVVVNIWRTLHSHRVVAVHEALDGLLEPSIEWMQALQSRSHLPLVQMRLERVLPCIAAQLVNEGMLVLPQVATAWESLLQKHCDRQNAREGGVNGMQLASPGAAAGAERRLPAQGTSRVGTCGVALLLRASAGLLESLALGGQQSREGADDGARAMQRLEGTLNAYCLCWNQMRTTERLRQARRGREREYDQKQGVTAVVI